jgi:predicted phosphodiesterase
LPDANHRIVKAPLDPTLVMLVFLHLSDIHFSSRSRNDPHELDEGIRAELRHDAVAECRRLGGASALLITGDIAAKGKTTEYANAADWLTELCAELQIGSENVWVIPGNHDVDTDAHQGANNLLRAELEAIELGHLDRRLADIFDDAPSSADLLAPLRPYGEFARRYDSHAPDHLPFWTHDFELDDRISVRVRGMNSALISDLTDESKKPRLVLGGVQAQIQREPGIVHLAMCHHPSDCLRDGALIDDVKANATVLLTGHDHHSDIRRCGDCHWIAAGALHPPRKEENWEPHYNILTLDLMTSATQEAPSAKVELCVYPRRWQAGRFVSALPAQSDECRTTELDQVAAQAVEAIGTDQERYRPQPAGADVTRIADRRVRLRHRFNALLDATRSDIAQELGLTLLEIQQVGAALLADSVIERAQANHRLADLWLLVENAHGLPDTDNPYRKDET